MGIVGIVCHSSKGPGIPYVWLLVPKMDPKSYNREYLDPEGHFKTGMLSATLKP